MERRWPQVEPGEKLAVHQKQVSAYERGANVPSREVLIKLAEVLSVSLDYLPFEAKGRPAKINIRDRKLLRRFEALDNPCEHDKSLVKEVLDLHIFKHIGCRNLQAPGPLDVKETKNGRTNGARAGAH